MNVDVIFRIAALGLLVAVLDQVLARAGKGEYSVLLTLSGLLAALLILLPYLSQLFRSLRELFSL
ncbi:MAG: stage III sporulation protein AC [Clostridia bacterium]|nr:stage III sporulation protein AC [Clostridia bacterium]